VKGHIYKYFSVLDGGLLVYYNLEPNLCCLASLVILQVQVFVFVEMKWYICTKIFYYLVKYWILKGYKSHIQGPIFTETNCCIDFTKIQFSMQKPKNVCVCVCVCARMKKTWATMTHTTSPIILIPQKPFNYHR
jgi:hypothetical protein